MSVLERLRVVSVSFRHHATAERERLGAVVAGLGPFPERCLIETCHRSELVLVSDEAPPADDSLVVFEGRAAVERVFRVAAGLDSAIVAEEQVLGQVRDAFSLALARGETGPLLNELLRRSVRFGKRVRSMAQPGAERSLAERAVRWALGRAELAEAHRPSALVVGTGETGRLLASRLAESGVACTIASRDPGQAARIADELPRIDGARHAAVATQDAPRHLGRHSLLAIAVRRSSPLFDPGAIAAVPIPVIDLSSPPAIGPGAREILGDRLLDLDRLGAAEGASALSPRAERQVLTELAAEVDRYLAWLVERANGSALVGLRRAAEDARARHVAQLKGRLQLDEDELATVERMTADLVAELIHLRTVEARERLLAASRS